MSAAARHLPDGRLLLLVDGELAPRQAAAARRHLHACEACRARAARIEASAAAFGHAYRGAYTTRASGTDLGGRSRDALKMQLRETGARERRGPSWVTACAFLLAALAGLEFLSSRSGPAGDRHAEARPIAYLTPGATRQVGLAELCAPRHAAPRAIPVHVRQAVVRDYSMELISAGEYELDYLITPELGGSDDRRNLWPERYSSQAWNARVKDELEELLPRLVCAGTVPLATAQREMASDWIAAYKKYFHTDRPLPASSPLVSKEIEGAALDVLPSPGRFELPAPRPH